MRKNIITNKAYSHLKTGLTGIASLFFYAATIGQAQAAMVSVICSILAIVQGDVGRAAATMGVLAVAFGATLGKVSWGLAITVAVGISLIFSAASYALYFSITSPC